MASAGDHKAGAARRAAGSFGLSQRTERIVFGTVFMVALFLAWEAVTAFGVEPPIILPSPAGVIAAFSRFFASSDVGADFAASGAELFIGFALAAAIGVVSGLAIGWYPRVGYFVDPLVSFLYAVPRVAVGPLLIVWLGIGLGSKVALVFLISVFPVLVNTSSGVRSLDANLLRVARCFGASDLQIFRTIALPGTVPFILGGLRLAIGQSLIGVFVAELLGAQYGIGAMVENAGQQFQTDMVFAGLLIFAAAGMLLTAIVRGLERRFDSWRV